MIKSVIFDWGGVLIEDPGPPMIRYCYSALGVGEDDYNESVGKFISDFRTGKTDEATFWGLVCDELGVAVPDGDSLWGAAFEAVYEPKPEMFSLVHRLRGNGYLIGLLSNTEMPCVEYWYKQGYDFFDEVIFSCVEGEKKPYKPVYEIAARRLNCQPEEAVFIDDRPRCAQGGADAGLNAIWFKSFDQLMDELKALGVKTD